MKRIKLKQSNGIEKEIIYLDDIKISSEERREE